ncbi:replication protein [Limosilactobacillus reuteri]|uniref:replication protein n=1 Tax=Limosilactobacillus reuteri TaxID=1598 RepID=UPI00195EA13E|nr:replication protein [Limosilactobacillus reuteri]MBM6813084.1 replication protein [Limosilactobacillus reuteri]
MMSPKSIARWQELKAKKLRGRTVPEDMEYKKLQMKHDTDVLTLNELKWKAELAEAVLTEATNNNDVQQRLTTIIDLQIGDNQKPFAKKDLHDFVTAFITKVKAEQQEQSHAKLLGNNPLKENELPNGNNQD